MEPRRDAGFTIYLAATNTGVVIGPLLAGLAQTTWGFHAGFAVAAVGMFLGLAQYCLVYKRLPVGAAQVVRPLPPRAGARSPKWSPCWSSWRSVSTSPAR